MLKRKIDRYEYIYDVACNYLDNEFITKNICDFKNDKCFAKRDFNCTCGCCRHFKHFFSNKLVQCEYLIDKHCSAKCLPCKMFTCDEIVRDKKIEYRFSDIFLLDKFFPFPYSSYYISVLRTIPNDFQLYLTSVQVYLHEFHI